MAKRMPTAKKTEHTLPEQLAEVVQDATPVEQAPAASVTPDQIADLILKGSDETKNAIRKALDLDKTHTRQRKSPVTNSQVRNHVRAVGEVTHAPGQNAGWTTTAIICPNTISIRSQLRRINKCRKLLDKSTRPVSLATLR